MIENSGNIFPAADILTYYEKNADWSLPDRGFIIEKGFREWLLAVVIEHTSKPAAPERLRIYTPHPNQRATDLVILVANLIGGVI